MGEMVNRLKQIERKVELLNEYCFLYRDKFDVSRQEQEINELLEEADQLVFEMEN